MSTPTLMRNPLDTSADSVTTTTFLNREMVSLTCVALLAGSLTSACGQIDACHPDSMGHAFRVSVVDVKSELCSAVPPPDPLIGTSFVIRIEDVVTGRSCKCGTGTIVESPQGFTWTTTGDSSSPGDCQGSFFSATLDVKTDTCSGAGYLSVHATGPGLAEIEYGEPGCEACTNRSYTVQVSALD